VFLVVKSWCIAKALLAVVYFYALAWSISKIRRIVVPNRIIIITAPSGSGKTTLVKRLLQAMPNLAFSISACTRSPRTGELDGRDYYFLTEPEFKSRIDTDEFVEWEMVYTGKYYGTLKSELQRIWDEGRTPLVDIDVKGALAIQEQYPDESLSIFIKAPSLEILRERLISRGTESAQMLEERLAKAEYELMAAPEFDRIIVNDDLEKATQELMQLAQNFIRHGAAVKA
jgi:guanylate kinase